jgi:hypothetical protein
MKNIVQRRLPLNVKYTVVDKKYIPINEGFGCTCDNCGKLIANIATVSNPEGSRFNIGFDCLETFLINNNLLSKIDVEEYEKVKKMIPKVLKIAKNIKETIQKNREIGVTITGIAFEPRHKQISDDWYAFDWISTQCRPYNDVYKIKDMDFDFLLATLRNIFPSINITVKEY